MTSRRAFTLLEVMLASAIGSMVILVGLSLYFVMDRADQAAKRRFETSSDLQRTRLVMQRAFSQFLMSDEPKPRRERPEDANAADSGKAAAAPPPRRDGRDPNAPPPPPRIILSVPESGVPMAGGAAGYAAASFQRLELVVFDSPVPTSRATGIGAWTRGGRASLGVRGRPKPAASAREAAETPIESDTPTEDMDAALAEAEQPVRAYRGAFQFLPQPLRDGEEPNPAAPPRYQLWWIPMPPRRPVDDPTGDPARDALFRANLEPPYLLCSDVLRAGWRLFDDRERKTAAQVTWDSELPAYVEFEVETAAGLRAEWMFEVNWAVGPEVRKPKNNKGAGGKGDASKSGDESSGDPKGSPSEVPAPPGGGKGAK